MTEKQIQRLDGLIYQSVSGFYYVWSDDKSYATKPRGVFRHQGQKPLVGDWVTIEVDPTDEKSESRLVQIAKRKNELVRPPIANVDGAIIVCSLVEPDLSLSLLDGMLASVEAQGIQPFIILTKYDRLVETLGQEDADQRVEAIQALYEAVGYACIVSNVLEEEDKGLDRLAELLHMGIYVVMGQSGVGKSTLLNRLLPDLQLETQTISQSLGRGRHTTREVTLYRFNDAYLADTPGFSSLNLDQIEPIDLTQLFPEILQASQYCQFRSCLHDREPNCGVKQQVEEGTIAQSRYDHYLQLLKDIQNRKPIYR